MKTLHLSVIIFSLALVPILFNVAFGSEPCPASGYVHYGPSRQSIPCYLVSQYNPTFEEQSQTINMTMFNNPVFCNQHFDQGPTLGETIGEKQCENPTYQINYNGSKLLVTNIINKTTFEERETITVIPELTNIGNHTVSISHCGSLFVTLIIDQHGKIVSPQYAWACPLFNQGVTLAPNVSTHGDSYGQITTLDTPGNYTLTSIASFGNTSNSIVLWSKPLQITILPEKYVQNKTSPVIITQVELDSPFLLMPANQTCTLPAKPGFINNCRTDLIPSQKVQCDYSLGSSTCEPDHQYTSGTNQSCFGPDGSPNAPQWFDLYNTQNNTVQIQLFQLIILQGEKPWGNRGLFPTTINLGPHGKCTFGLGPVDEPLSLDQTNMGFVVSYTFEGKNYTASTPPMTDLYNDTRTWQYDGNKWTFAEQNTITVPEFPLPIPILLISIASLIVFYRMKFRK